MTNDFNCYAGNKSEVVKMLGSEIVGSTTLPFTRGSNTCRRDLTRGEGEMMGIMKAKGVPTQEIKLVIPPCD